MAKRLPNLVTVGASAVPPKSPANLIFPFLVVVASNTDEVIVAGSANAAFTNSVVATAVLLSVIVIVPATTLVPKLTLPVNVGEAKLAFKFNAVCVNVDIGFASSEVLLTLLIPRLTLAFDKFEAPVPPLEIATIPFTLVALPVSVPEKFPTNVFAVITPAAKSVLPSLLTIVFATDKGVVFKNSAPPGNAEIIVCTNAVVAI